MRTFIDLFDALESFFDLNDTEQKELLIELIIYNL